MNDLGVINFTSQSRLCKAPVIEINVGPSSSYENVQLPENKYAEEFPRTSRLDQVKTFGQ